MKSDDIPAFPELQNQAYDQTWYTISGMMLRDYFAAHAPEMPNWYKTLYIPRPYCGPKEPDYDEICKEVGVGYARQAYRECNYTYGVEKERYEAEEKNRMYIMWRWYYADMMLAERENGDFTYNKELDSAYIKFSDEQIKKTKHCESENINLDLDENSNVVGMELLSLKKLFHKLALKLS